MCGRTGLSLRKDQMQCACSYKPKGEDKYIKPDWLPEYNADKEYTPSYNIAPTNITPVLVSSSRFKNAAISDRVLIPMMWGVIPSWHKIDDPQTWNNSYDEVSGWTGVRLLHMAGLYNVWQNDNVIINSYSIITMDSNTTLDWLHHRMPVVLDSEEQIHSWLDIDNVNPDKALSYLKPVNKLSWHPVSPAVNNSRYKADDCNKRVAIEKSKCQKTLNMWFTKQEKRKTDIDSPESKRVKN